MAQNWNNPKLPQKSYKSVHSSPSPTPDNCRTKWKGRITPLHSLWEAGWEPGNPGSRPGSFIPLQSSTDSWTTEWRVEWGEGTAPSSIRGSHWFSPDDFMSKAAQGQKHPPCSFPYCLWPFFFPSHIHSMLVLSTAELKQLFPLLTSLPLGCQHMSCLPWFWGKAFMFD